MTNIELLEQLHIVYTLLIDDNNKEAERVFTAMHIVNSTEHLAFPKNIRHLIWNLHVYLIVRDKNNATDKNQILMGFEELFPNKNN